MPHGIDVARDVTKTTSVTDIFRAGFSGSSLNQNRWDPTTSAGGTLTVSGGNLTLGLGTVANEVNSVMSKETFRIPCRLQVSLNLSQRIANQDIHVELVSVNPQTGVPDGLNVASFVFNGTTATQAICRCQNEGGSNLDSSAQTILTTASQSVFELQANLSVLRFINVAQDSVATPTLTFVRTQSLPDPNALYKIRIRGVNGATPPASNTNIVVNYVAASEFNNVQVELTDARGPLGFTPSNSIPVTITPSGSASTTVQGTAASDAVAVGNPVMTGVLARTSNITAVASGDAVSLIGTTVGAGVMKLHSIPELDWQTAQTITTATTTAIQTAAGAGLKRYLTGITYQNTNATATNITVQRGTTTILLLSAPASMANPVQLSFVGTPLQTAANEALNVITSAAGNVLLNLQGYTAP